MFNLTEQGRGFAFISTAFACESATMKRLFSTLFSEELTDGVPYIDQEDRDILIIRRIDPCVMTNGTNHHTSQYDLMSRPNEPQLVVRRGKPFRLDIYLSRSYSEEKDGISFIFTVEGTYLSPCHHYWFTGH